ncbi:MAG TPA: hypothetical protein VGS07_30230 [Thermoanaerobaculia bacterium]|nr:hypothetical protein [Thermoanaerobaculia bacterium]
MVSLLTVRRIEVRGTHRLDLACDLIALDGEAEPAAVGGMGGREGRYWSLAVRRPPGWGKGIPSRSLDLDRDPAAFDGKAMPRGPLGRAPPVECSGVDRPCRV